jgi:hypothetical protein
METGTVWLVVFDVVSFISRQVADISVLGITEAFRVKSQVLVSASEAAEMIIRVDDILKSAPRFGCLFFYIFSSFVLQPTRSHVTAHVMSCRDQAEAASKHRGTAIFYNGNCAQTPQNC